MKIIRRAMLLALYILLVLCMNFAEAGEKEKRVTVTGRASIYIPPSEEGASGPAITVGLGINYRVSNHFSTDLTVEYVSYKMSKGTKTLIPVTLSGIYKIFSPGSPLQVYLGSGLGMYFSTVQNESSSTFGYHLLTGLNIRSTGIGNLRLEFRYYVPDINRPQSAGTSISFGMVGRY